MDFRYLAKVFSRILIFLLIFALGVNVCYQVIAGSVTQVDTVEARTGQISFSVSAVATLFRTEHTLICADNGLFFYGVSDGEKVGNNKRLVSIYEDTPENQALIDEITRIQGEISVIEEARNLESSYTISEIEKKITELSRSMSSLTDSGNSGECDRLMGHIRVLLCIRELKNGRADYKQRLDELQKALEQAKEKLGAAGASVRADRAGCFCYECDGYEDAYGGLDLTNMSLEELSSLADVQPSLKQGAVGKIITDYKWYLLVPMSREESMNITVGKDYPVSISGSPEPITMRAEKTVRKTGSESAFVIMSNEKIPEDFEFSRSCKVELFYDTYEGFKISYSALKYVDGYAGVYVLHGSVVDFRRVDVIASDDSYVICDVSFTTSEGKYKSLKYYDNVIVKGEKLYVGKIIN